MKTFAGDNGHFEFCLKCGNAKGTGHSKHCKHFVDYKAENIKLRAEIRRLRNGA